MAQDQLNLRYSLDQWPPPGPLALISLQWLLVVMPGLLVLGEVVAQAQGLGAVERVEFLQRLILACGLTQAAQVAAGHRLPGLVGPSAVLMVGVIATLASGQPAVYGGLALGGALTAALGFSGLVPRLRALYTPPVLATTLLLIAVSLAPTMRDLLYAPTTVGGGPASFAYALGLVLAMIWAQHRLTGLASSAVLLMGMLLGSAAYRLAGLAVQPARLPEMAAAGLPSLWPQQLALEPGVAAAFVLCYLAVISNELATVEAVGGLIASPEMDRRQGRAVGVTGLGGLAAGLWGVVGPVTYSVSPGMVVATKSASRWTLLLPAAALAALAAWPQGLAWFYLAPQPVVGAVLFFLMANTVYAALRLLVGGGAEPGWTDGVVVGAAMTAGLVVAFMPPETARVLPAVLRPLAGNAFVVGLAVALVLEHLLLRRFR
jgi:uracil permease